MEPSSTPVPGPAYGGRLLPTPDNAPRSASQTLAFCAAFTSTWTGVRIAGINLTDFLIVAALTLALFAASRNGRRLPIYAWAVIPPAALFLIAAIGSIVRGDPLWSDRIANEWVAGSNIGAELGGPLPLLARMLISITAVAIIVVGVSQNSQDGKVLLEKLMRTWAAGAAISAAYGVVKFTAIGQSSPLGNLPFLVHHISETRATGLANHPNSLGQTIAGALPMLIYMVITAKGLPKVALALSLPVSMYAVFLSGSRAAMLCGAVLSVLSFAAISISGKQINKWALPVACLLAALAIVVLPEAFRASRFVDSSAQVSDASRTAALQAGVDLFSANALFGAGVGSWTNEMVPLIILTSGGVIYFLIFYGCLSYPLLTQLRTTTSLFATILLMSALGVFGFGLLNNALTERYLYWPFAALFALKILVPPRSPRSSSAV